MERVIWSKKSLNSLNKVWKFYSKINTDLADKIVHEIVFHAQNVVFAEQYQNEGHLKPNQRRAVIRHFKIIYRTHNSHINILDVFDTRQNPKKLKP